MSKTWRVIGTMSGTSMDGLDIACCSFHLSDNQWSFEIEKSTTVAYNEDWRSRLSNISSLPLPAYLKLDHDLGRFFGNSIVDFLAQDHRGEYDFIVSHGHTVYHNPKEGISNQIASAAAIASICNKPVINQLRLADISEGGQGAPIVPIGDLHLFSEFKYCLNLGGIMNVSVKEGEEIRAWDVCACNLLLNYLASQRDLTYDANGDLAKQGKLNANLLAELGQWAYLNMPAPKSLEASTIREDLFTILDKSEASVEDKMNTSIQFILDSLKADIGSAGRTDRILVTGGGAHNDYMIAEMKKKLDCEVHIPSSQLVDQKEAMVMAFFGLLRWLETPNYITSVTGAREAAIGGAIHLPKP